MITQRGNLRGDRERTSELCWATLIVISRACNNLHPSEVLDHLLWGGEILTNGGRYTYSIEDPCCDAPATKEINRRIAFFEQCRQDTIMHTKGN
jgi:hypothetical protein